MRICLLFSGYYIKIPLYITWEEFVRLGADTSLNYLITVQKELADTGNVFFQKKFNTHGFYTTVHYLWNKVHRAGFFGE